MVPIVPTLTSGILAIEFSIFRNSERLLSLSLAHLSAQICLLFPCMLWLLNFLSVRCHGRKCSSDYWFGEKCLLPKMHGSHFQCYEIWISLFPLPSKLYNTNGIVGIPFFCVPHGIKLLEFCLDLTSLKVWYLYVILNELVSNALIDLSCWGRLLTSGQNGQIPFLAEIIGVLLLFAKYLAIYHLFET